MPRPWRATHLYWIWERLTWLFGMYTATLRRTNGGLGYPWSQAFAVLSVIGAFSLWRRRREVAVLVVLPVIVTLAAAAFRVYPFSGRVVTFLLPLMSRPSPPAPITPCASGCPTARSPQPLHSR